MSTYRDRPLLLARPNWASKPKTENHLSIDVFADLGYGNFQVSEYESTLRFQAEFLCKTKQEISEMWAFVDARGGRLEGFWMPSWRRDAVVTQPFAAADTQLTISTIGYPAFWRSNKIVGRYLYLEWPDRTYQIVSVRDASTVSDEDVLTLTGAIGADCTDPSGLFVCFLLFVRLDLDLIEAEYHSVDVATFELSFMTVGLEELIFVTTTSSTTTTTTSTSTTTSTTETTTSTSMTSTTSTTTSTQTSGSTTASTASTTSSTVTRPPMDWYVSPSGSDVTGDGSFANPYQHVYRAAINVGWGDTIWLMDGTYAEERSMDFYCSVTIRSFSEDWRAVKIDGWTPVTTGNYYSRGLFRIRANYVTLELIDLTIREPDSISYSDIVQIYEISGTSNYRRNARARLIGNFFYASRTLGLGECIDLATYAHTTSQAWVESYKNTFRGFLSAIHVQNTIAHDSIFIDNTNGITDLYGQPYTCTESYNCFYGNTRNLYLASGTPAVHATDITSNPLMVGPTDARLKTGSPCLEAGIQVSPYVLDYIGTAPDIGCHEDVTATGVSSTTTTSTSTTSTSTTTSSSTSTTTSSTTRTTTTTTETSTSTSSTTTTAP